MWVVWKLIKPSKRDRLEDLALGALSFITISFYQTHFGYMPIYEKYEDAVAYYPNEQIIKLPIEEVSIENIKK